MIKTSKFNYYIILTLILILFFSINTDAEKKLKVYTSVFPVREAVRNIGGEKIEVKQVVPSGAEIHGYEPSPREIAALENSDIFFYIGIGLEPWSNRVVDNLKNSGIKTVRVTEDLKLRKISEDHNHKENDENQQREHENYDPHVWLDPNNMKEMGLKIKETLIEEDPDNKKFYKDNYQKFTDKLNQLDNEFEENLNSTENDFIMVSHAVFGYLGDRYDFEQLSVTGITPHEEPSPGTIADLVDEAREHNIKYIFRETLSDPETVNILVEEINLETLPLHPVSGLTESQKEAGEDYFSLMRKNLENLKKALGEKENETNN
ncbi:MAG: metal ABC transporter substrate-binding protein [Halanaerobiaceae bacterium]